MTDVSRWDKGRFDHIAHIEVADPLGILAVSLVPFLRFCVLWVRKSNEQVILL